MSEAERIRGLDDRRLVEVDCPEWGMKVYVIGLMGFERDELEEQFRLHQGIKHFRAKLVAKTACDAEGKRLFVDSDWEWLIHKSALVLDRLTEAALEAAGIAPKSLDDAKKN